MVKNAGDAPWKKDFLSLLNAFSLLNSRNEIQLIKRQNFKYFAFPDVLLDSTQQNMKRMQLVYFKEPFVFMTSHYGTVSTIAATKLNMPLTSEGNSCSLNLLL